MFEGDYTIYGRHATYIKYLVNDAKAFKRYIDVYMMGAVLGMLNDRRSTSGDSAESFGMQCEIHTTTMNYMDLVNLHVSCAIRNCRYFEYFVPEEDFMFPMKGLLPIDEKGIITVPDKPGIGGELDWELIERNCVSHQMEVLE